ncbi:hypothetical protein PseAD21_05095 [Pseudomonas sp. AD21]|nr:hypothetical protein PseAD21_05095 [Pseudomonas sp. AD21]
MKMTAPLANGLPRKINILALQRAIDAGRVAIDAVAYSGEWGEVDSSEDLSAYQ